MLPDNLEREVMRRDARGSLRSCLGRSVKPYGLEGVHPLDVVEIIGCAFHVGKVMW